MQYLTTQSPLGRIKDLLHTQLPDYVFAHLRFRGTSFPLDPMMGGYTRFSKRLGVTVSMLLPDTWTELTADLPENGRNPEVLKIPQWVVPGTLLSFGGSELHEIHSIDREDLTLQLFSQVSATYSSEIPVVYTAVPVYIDGDYSAGETVFSLDSDWRLMFGDELGVEQTREQINSLGQYDVQSFDLVSTGSDGHLNYDLTIEGGLPRDMLSGERLYLMCNPGYESNPVLVPTVPAVNLYPIGPFLVDWFSGELLDNVWADETFSIETLNAGDIVISPLQPVEKNTPVLDAPIPDSAPLFWTCSRGSLQYGPHQTHLQTDSSGKAFLHTDLVPGWDPDHHWLVQLRATNPDTLVRIRFRPNDWQSATLPANTWVTVPVDLPTGSAQAEGLDIVVAGQPDTKVEIGEWTRHGARVRKIRYTVVARLTGGWNWFCTGIMAKPFFMNVEPLRARAGMSNANNGSIVLPQD